MRLLLVEDDQFFGEIFSDYLSKAGYVVDWLKDGSEAELAVKMCEYDLLLLDLGLPRRAGMDILKAIRINNSKLPVLIISGQESVEARVQGLDSGADDFLVKPFTQDELMARIRAILRRSSRATDSIITHGLLSLDLDSHEVSFGGKLVDLPRREFAMLKTLLNQRGKVMAKQQIEDKLYGWDSEVASNAIDVHIHQLRKKFGSDLIHTLRGVGYKIPLPHVCSKASTSNSL